VHESGDRPVSLMRGARPEKQDRHAQTGGDLVHPELQHILFLHPPWVAAQAQRLSEGGG
jgi:hypothetical protein